MSKWLIIIGLILIIMGLLLNFAPWTLNWFGKLPGDIDIKNENSRIFIPITSMIVISIIISVVIHFFKH